MEQTKTRQAVVLLSGGLDSATTLAVARHEGFECHALSFDYGQRHRHELDAARRVAGAMNVADHRIVKIDLSASGGFGHSALTDAIEVPKDRPDLESTPPRAALETRRHSHAGRRHPHEHIPITYVPARNTIFLSIALGYAEVVGAFDLFLGVNAVDYSGYPDCRQEFVQAFEKLANLATAVAVEGKGKFRVHAPLIHMTKADIIRKGLSLGVDYSLTHSCYDPADDGSACGRCDSCRLRLAGFAAAGASDPGRYCAR